MIIITIYLSDVPLSKNLYSWTSQRSREKYIVQLGHILFYETTFI